MGTYNGWAIYLEEAVCVCVCVCVCVWVWGVGVGVWVWVWGEPKAQSKNLYELIKSL